MARTDRVALCLRASVSQRLHDERVQLHAGRRGPVVDLTRECHEEPLAVVADLDDVVALPDGGER